MNCTGQPLTDSMAKAIEGMNLYCEYNRAWIELYLNTLKWMNPYAFYYYSYKQNKDDQAG